MCIRDRAEGTPMQMGNSSLFLVLLIGSCVVLVVLYISPATMLLHLAAAYALYGYFVAVSYTHLTGA